MLPRGAGNGPIARVAVTLAMLGCWAATVLALSPPIAHADDGLPPLSGEQAAERFRTCGYGVKEARAESLGLERLRPWRVDLTSFVVRDAGELDALDGRGLTVWVFADQARAMMAHLDLHLRDEQLWGTPVAWSDDHGPGPGAGLGGTVWRGNVALAQLSAMLPSEDALGRAPRPRFRDQQRDQAPYAVDRDFVECLTRP
jgi:hypothetical protein